MSLLRKHYPPLQKLFHKGRGNLLVKYHPFKTLFESERPRLFDTASASHVAVKDAYERRDKDLLHWHVTANVSANDIPFAIVRNKLKRRYTSAFCSALKEKGYQTNGKVINQSKANLKEKNMPQRDLKGTLEVYLFHKMAHGLSFERMLQDAKSVIDAVSLQQARAESRPQTQAQAQAQLQPQLQAQQPQTQTHYLPWHQGQTPIHQTVYRFGEMLLNGAKHKNADQLVKRVQLA